MNQLDLEVLIASYKDSLARGDINQSEYIELLHGIDIQDSINKDVLALEQQELLNTILKTAIQAASMAA